MYIRWRFEPVYCVQKSQSTCKNAIGHVSNLYKSGTVTVTENWRDGVGQFSGRLAGRGRSGRRAQPNAWICKRFFLIGGVEGSKVPAARGHGPCWAVPFRAGQSALGGCSGGLLATRRRRQRWKVRPRAATTDGCILRRFFLQAEGVQEGGRDG